MSAPPKPFPFVNTPSPAMENPTTTLPPSPPPPPPATPKVTGSSKLLWRIGVDIASAGAATMIIAPSRFFLLKEEEEQRN
jgi:hypothetical protein